MNTKIEWAQEVWNPMTGCTRISPGCKNCYAERMVKRHKNLPGYNFDNPFQVTLHPDRLDQPFHWKKTRWVFVCSMGDLFHEVLLFEVISTIFRVMELAKQHTYLLLTKRPERMLAFINEYFEGNELKKRFPHVYFGVTAENQKQADKRIPILLQIPAAVRFVSVEPLLSSLDLSKYLDPCWCGGCGWRGSWNNDLDETLRCPECRITQPGLLHGLNWVICGTESLGNKPGRKPEYWLDNIKDLKNQCVDAGVPFFLKQMPTGFKGYKLTKMPKLDGQIWNQMPGRCDESNTV